MRKITVLIQIIELFCLLFFYLIYKGNYNPQVLAFLVFLGVVNILLFFYARRVFRLSLQEKLISTVFVLGYIIVFFQKYVDLILGFCWSSSPLFFQSSLIIKCCTMSVIGIVSFSIGYLTKNRKRFNVKDHQNQGLIKPINTYYLRYILIISTLIFAFFHFEQMFSNNSYSQERTMSEVGTMVQYSDVFFQIFFILTAAYSINNSYYYKIRTFNEYLKIFGIGSFVCGLIYCIIMFFIGDRGPIIICVLVFVGSYYLSTGKRLHRSTFVIAIVVAAFSLTIIGGIRMMDKSQGIKGNSSVFLEEKSQEKSVSPFTSELANSVQTFHYSVAYVPDVYPYVYGAFIIRTLTSLVPFGDRILFSFWHPHFRFNSSAFFVTWLIQGDTFTYGNGTSCNADLYLSFGLLGIILGLFLWGRFYNYLELTMSIGIRSIPFGILYLFSLGYALYVSRAYFLCYTADCFFALIINWLYRLLVNK